MKNLTIAEKVAKIWNGSRNTEFSAIIGFEVVMNANLDRLACVKLHHRELTFKDGSILFTLDTSIARQTGLTDFDYSYKAQEKAY